MMKTRLFIFLMVFTSVLAAYAQDEPEIIEFEHDNIRFSFDARLASEVKIEVVPEVPLTDDIPFWGANPEYMKLHFVDYAGGESFFHDPAIYVYPTENFPEYSEDEYGYQPILEALVALLEESPELEPYSVPTTSGEMNLPFLPLFNAAQVFRAQVEYLEFEGGSGIRFLSYYSQAVNPITNAEIFYTFQGVTDDGSTYLAAVLPVDPGLFFDELPGQDFDYETFASDYPVYLEEGVAGLNALSPEDTNPSLDLLDALIMSIQVGE